MEENQLLPCPFCGGPAGELRFDDVPKDDVNFGGACISCQQCGACSPVHFDRKENLYSSWNDRHISTGELFNKLVSRIDFDGMNPRTFSLGELEGAIAGANLSTVTNGERLRSALDEISADIKPELCASELELIVWWGRQVDRLQAIAAAALTNGER